MHTDQWRYEREFTDYHTVPQHGRKDTTAQGHTMDMQVRAVRQGWLPFYPQFPRTRLRSSNKLALAARNHLTRLPVGLPIDSRTRK